MYAYSKESKPANAFAGRVSKRLPLNTRSLWGGKETNCQAHTRLHQISTSACAKVAAAVAEVEEAWGGAGAGAVDNVRVGKHRRLHVSCVHTHASTHKDKRAVL
jgi:hypothetical protein